MKTKSYYLGLSGFVPDFDELDLGDGIILRKTYAHIFGTTMAAFAPRPSKPEKIGKLTKPPISPGPWVAVDGGFAFDINAELEVPTTFKGLSLPEATVLDILVGLIRMSVRPQICAPVISRVSFSKAKDSPNFTISCHEVYERHTPLKMESQEKVSEADFDWLRFHLKGILLLTSTNPILRGAIEVITDIQFIKHRGLATVSIWAALESIFKIDAEIRHRVSAYIATFLEKHGDERFKLYQRCLELYKSRCLAAHQGRETHLDHLLESILILRRVIIRIVEVGKMPESKFIEKDIFTSSFE